MKTKTRAFAILHTWPDIKNAEYEVVQRIVSAGLNIGAEVFVIDNDGYPLWASDRVISRASPRLTAADCDYMISLHFESPKLIDIPSYTALWNPPKFYDVFGYQQSVEKLASHDDVLSCGSTVADTHALNLFEGYGRVLPVPLPTLYHSVPAPHLEPTIDGDARLFYVGINWERITGQKGRHHDLLERLDEADLIDIYGPEEFQGVEPWEGFRNYRGSIPFDGRSILTDINRAGVCLALSSEEHQKSGIMSNRLFEGLAAGAAIIANPHPIVERHFSDCVYVIDDTKGSQELARDVSALLLDIRRNPAEALRRARLGQARFRESFTLEESLGTLFDVHDGRVAERSASRAAGFPDVDVLVCYGQTDSEVLIDLVQTAAAQAGVAVHIVLICDGALHASCHDAVRQAAAGAASFRTILGELHLRPRDLRGRPRRSTPMGGLVAAALDSVAAPLFCILSAGDRWFAGHLAKLAAALSRTPDAYVAASGALVEEQGDGRRTKRRFETLLFDQAWKILHATDMPGPGRFLFRASLLPRLPRHLIGCLDGLEHRALALRGYLDGPLAQSGTATYCSDRRVPPSSGDLVAHALQVRMIMDSVRADPAWQARIPLLHTPPVDLASFDRVAADPKQQIELDTPLPITKGGSGAALLAEGFSAPEDDLTWVDGKVGSIQLTLPDDVACHLVTLLLTVGTRRSRKTGDDQACTIKINGQTVLDQLALTEAQQTIRIPLGMVDVLEDGDDLRLEIKLQHADRVYSDAGRVVDTRRLGLWVNSLELRMARSVPDYPDVDANLAYALVAGGGGLKILDTGFAAPEPNWTWIDGTSARLTFRLPPDIDPARHAVRLTTGGRGSRKTGDSQAISVKVNKIAVLKDVVIPEGGCETYLKFPKDMQMDAHHSVAIDIELRHAEQVDEGGRIVDHRRLGLWLSALEIVSRDAVGNAPSSS